MTGAWGWMYGYERMAWGRELANDFFTISCMVTGALGREHGDGNMGTGVWRCEHGHGDERVGSGVW